eukprot:Skav204567  [mRNA]  locus=scaffold2218:49849:56536:+ [translate_table: standard]
MPPGGVGAGDGGDGSAGRSRGRGAASEVEATCQGEGQSGVAGQRLTEAWPRPAAWPASVSMAWTAWRRSKISDSQRATRCPSCDVTCRASLSSV